MFLLVLVVWPLVFLQHWDLQALWVEHEPLMLDLVVGDSDLMDSGKDWDSHVTDQALVDVIQIQ